MPSTEDALLNGLRRLVSTVQFLHAFDLSRQPVNAETDAGVFHHLIHPNGLNLTSTVSGGFCGLGFGSSATCFPGLGLSMRIHGPMVAAQVRRFTFTHRARSTTELDSDCTLIDGVVEQSLIAPVQFDGKQGMGHGVHYARRCLFGAAHATSNPNRSAVFPAKVGELANKNHDAVNGMLVF